MTREASSYSRLPWGTKPTWVADDHLLAIETRLFRESYSRLYWGDVRAVLLYSLEQPATSVLLAEVSSLLLVIAGAICVNVLWGAVAGVVFAGVYAAWRLTRPKWGAQMCTRLSAVAVPLASSLRKSQAMLDEIKRLISAAQESFKVEKFEMEIASLVPDAQPKAAKMWPYAVIFAAGLLFGLSDWMVVFYCLTFLVAFFLPRKLDVPISVRAGLVLNELLAVVRAAGDFLMFRRPSFGSLITLHQEFELASTIFCCYGLIAIALRVRRTGQYTARSSRIFGVETPVA